MDPAQSIESLIGNRFIRKKSHLGDKEKETVYLVEECNLEQVAECKFVLLFFSAGWCTPCKHFLQVLKDFYSEVNLNEKIVEILYVSCDRDEAGFKESYEKMPWITVPFANPLHDKLKKQFEIIGVPVVLVCEASTGFVVSHKGRKDIFDHGVACLKHWTDDMPAAKEKKKHLDEGEEIVRKQKIAE